VITVKFKRLNNGDGLRLPYRATSGAAGMDICSASTLVLQPYEQALIPTGFAVAVPVGYELQCRPRSGLAYKHGITIVNSPGTIDSDYRGEICVILKNGSAEFKIDRGDRIAQLVVAQVPDIEVLEVTELDETVRSDGGFGSTGRN
jgi:dUTP pyrophosphatase